VILIRIKIFQVSAAQHLTLISSSISRITVAINRCGIRLDPDSKLQHWQYRHLRSNLSVLNNGYCVLDIRNRCTALKYECKVLLAEMPGHS
jgi:hypothetical protein